MRKATVTYRSPPGDAKDVVMGGVAFHDGKAVEINSYDNPHLMSKLQGSNALFDVEVGKEDNSPPPKVKRGRPSNADIAAAKAASEQADKEAKEAKEKADMAKSDHEKLSKATDREVVKPPAEGAKSDIKAGQSEATNHDFEKDRQEQTAKRDAQARGIGPAEDRPDNQRPVGQTAGQNQSNYGGQGQSGYVPGQTGAQGQVGGHGQATTQNQPTADRALQGGLTPGNPGQRDHT